MCAKEKYLALHIHIQLLDQMIRCATASRLVSGTFQKPQGWTRLSRCNPPPASDASAVQMQPAHTAKVGSFKGRTKTSQLRQGRKNWHEEYKIQLFLKTGGVQEKSKKLI